ncbi:MAG TPA: TetR/AcrR family transcriptional regulator [Actinomycetota bacterium]|jgi:AcrR family transcriptional regulator|nr:TetR/AcrR family transcriptional regulator [Actinomycetota bacterium]
MPRTGGTATRARIVQAAVQLFGRHGYGGTSLDEVAATVGVRKQTLLYYFPSKADLFAAASAEAAQAVYAALDGALKENDPGGLDRLPVFIEAASELARGRPEVLGLIREVARSGPPVSDAVAKALGPLVDSAVDWFERGMDEGVLRRQNPRIALLTIYSAVIGYLTESSVQRAILDPRSRRGASGELVGFLRAALAP